MFFAFHVYWYAGGAFGRAGALPALVPDSAGGWIFEVLVVSAFPLGVGACLAIARGWPLGRMRRAVGVVVWLGCALLALRGGSGLVDDLTRAAGLLPNGITGLSLEETMGTAHPSASELWSGYATDAYFAVGGLIFGLLACRCRTRRTRQLEREPGQGEDPRREQDRAGGRQPGAQGEQLTQLAEYGGLDEIGDDSVVTASELAERGDPEELRARADADDRAAGVRLPDALTKQGRHENAARVRQFGLNPDGSISHQR